MGQGCPASSTRLREERVICLQDNMATHFLPQTPSQGLRHIHENTGHQDPHIRTASSSSTAASHHESILQKIPTEHDFFMPARAQRVSIPDRPSRNFDATNAQQEMSQLGMTGKQAWRPTPSVATDLSYGAANMSLEELYGKGLTSYPHQTVIEAEMKASLLSLLSIDAFEYMLAKRASREVFRDWLIHQGGADKLDRWTEESRINQLHIEAQQSAQHLLERYHDSDGKDSAKPSQIDSLNKLAIKETMNLAHSSQVLVASRQHLLQSLYNETFKQFITSKLIEVTKMKLRSGVDESICKGLGSFLRKGPIVASQPRAESALLHRDNPVVMVSPSFTQVFCYTFCLARNNRQVSFSCSLSLSLSEARLDWTSHDRDAIIGKNCRFLQGPGTSPQSIQRLRVALQKGLPSVELLLNYKADGTPFYCLLSIIPLFDDKGFLSYYIGGQINVTDEMRNNQLMALISQSNTAPVEITSEDFQITTTPKASHADSKRMATNDPILFKRLASSIDSRQSSSINSDRSKPPRYLSFDWFNLKNRHEKKLQEVEFTKPDDRCEFNATNLSESLSAFQSNYSRLILFNQATCSIVFITPEALNFLGFPTRTMEEAYSSALLHHDFFDLLGNCKTTRKTPLSKKVLKKIVARKSSASFEGELSWAYKSDDDRTKSASAPPMWRSSAKTHHPHFSSRIPTESSSSAPVIVATQTCTEPAGKKMEFVPTFDLHQVYLNQKFVLALSSTHRSSKLMHIYWLPFDCFSASCWPSKTTPVD
ncbi:hypothetical protein VP01_43g3 [Puccinia sorghi]|uniref:PAC domain-containing protein n=1 Tax=Puccinia sorghi TaxID=27349 RepID=A0A0L6UPM1_9BASI|nr:hypothetical protein VP01_43g3 [Puccinia sorghi]